MLQSWKFWKNITTSNRKAVKEAIHKANQANLSVDIKVIQTQLNAKIGVKKSLAKR